MPEEKQHQADAIRFDQNLNHLLLLPWIKQILFAFHLHLPDSLSFVCRHSWPDEMLSSFPPPMIPLLMIWGILLTERFGTRALISFNLTIDDLLFFLLFIRILIKTQEKEELFLTLSSPSPPVMILLLLQSWSSSSSSSTTLRNDDLSSGSFLLALPLFFFFSSSFCSSVGRSVH